MSKKNIHIKALLISLLFMNTCVFANAHRPVYVDVCIYGGTSAGVIAAYTAAMMHKKVLLADPGKRLGGLSSGGLGYTDIGNKYAVTGVAKDFYRRIGKHYGKLEQWIFEPKVALAIFMEYVKEGGFNVRYNTRLKTVKKNGTTIESITVEQANENNTSALSVIHAKQFLDCTYEGDLMAKAGVSYTVGREDNATYNETVNGVQLRDMHQFPDGIDPYKIPDHPESGLLWGISNSTLAMIGSGDKNIQAYNFRICLSDSLNNQISITRPADYDSSRYELLLRYLQSYPAKNLKAFLKMDLLPNHKADINNFGPFSTDMIGMNYQYPDGDYATRAVIYKQHEEYTKGLLYFIGHDPRVPENLRHLMLQWGYPKDEYEDNNHWTSQLYIREARRMLGEYVMTQANCQGKEMVSDGIGLAAYMMDSHNTQRIVVNGMVKNEGDVQLKDVKPYPVAYRSITPKRNECTNLLVPVCLSVSHMAYGSIRMEPVFMVIAQSAAAAACMAIDNKTSVQKINVKALQQELTGNPLVNHSLPEIVVDNDDAKHFYTSGKWIKKNEDGYGTSYLFDSTSSAANAKFIPYIHVKGDYKVYIFYPRIRNASFTNEVSVFDGKSFNAKTIHYKESEMMRGDWIGLGTYNLSNGENSYVEVRGKEGITVADAVLFIPVKN